MLDNLFGSVKEYARTRITNPLLGTFIVVFIIRNFEFLYALFNIDRRVTLTQRINFIEKYSKVYLTFWNTVSNIGIAFGILSITFLGLWFSRALTNLYKSGLNFINKKTDIGSTIPREEHESLKNSYNTVLKDRTLLRSETRKLEDEYKELREKLINKEEVISKLTRVENEKSEHIKSIEKTINESKQLEKQLKEKNITLNTENEKLDSELDKIKLNNNQLQTKNFELEEKIKNNESSQIKIIDELNSLKPKYLELENINKEQQTEIHSLKNKTAFIYNLKDVARGNHGLKGKKMRFMTYLSDFLDSELRTIDVVIKKENDNLETINLLKLIENKMLPGRGLSEDEDIVDLKNAIYYLYRENNLKQFIQIANQIQLGLEFTDSIDIKLTKLELFTPQTLSNEITYKLSEVGLNTYKVLNDSENRIVKTK